MQKILKAKIANRSVSNLQNHIHFSLSENVVKLYGTQMITFQKQHCDEMSHIYDVVAQVSSHPNVIEKADIRKLQ